MEEGGKVWVCHDGVPHSLDHMFLLVETMYTKISNGDDIGGWFKELVECNETKGLSDPKMGEGEGLSTDWSNTFDEEPPWLGILWVVGGGPSCCSCGQGRLWGGRFQGHQ